MGKKREKYSRRVPLEQKFFTLPDYKIFENNLVFKTRKLQSLRLPAIITGKNLKSAIFFGNAFDKKLQ